MRMKRIKVMFQPGDYVKIVRTYPSDVGHVARISRTNLGLNRDISVVKIRHSNDWTETRFCYNSALELWRPPNV
jgi:hypothetical protein